MWNFANSHPTIGIILLSLIAVAFVLLIVVLIKAIKNGGDVEASLGKDGVGLKVGGKKKKSKEEFETDIIRNATLLSSSIISWKNDVTKEIDKKTNDTISSAIRYAVTKIDNMVNVAKIEYGETLKRKKGGKLSNEDNYQTIICGFLMDQTKEYFKDVICGAIREDHFEEKTEAEIKSIGENCYFGIKLIFEDKLDIINKDVIKEIAEKYEPKIKKETNELIELTAEKYKNLKKEKEEVIKDREDRFKVEMKMKFPVFSEETINSLVSYYS